MRTDVRQLERPVRVVTDPIGDDREDEMSPEIRGLVLSFGWTASTDDSEGLVDEHQDSETSLSEIE